jgi:hypothetical protein
MSSLTVQLIDLDKDSLDFYNGKTIAVEIFDIQGESVYKFALGKPETLEVDPGAYVVQARLPSGETVAAQANVGEGENYQVDLYPTRSPNGWVKEFQLMENSSAKIQQSSQDDTLSIIGSAYSRKIDMKRFLGSRQQGRSVYSIFRSSPISEQKSSEKLSSLWLRLWSGEAWKGFYVKPSSWFQGIEFEINYAVAEVQTQEECLNYLQLGGEGLARRFIALPAGKGSLLKVLIRSSRTPTGLNSGLTLKVLGNSTTNDFLGYIVAGTWESADFISDTILTKAKKELNDTQNPFGAVLCGYYLLLKGDFDRLQDLPLILDQGYPWLPDGAIIHAWKILQRSVTDGDMKLARQRLIEATRRGLPIYTQCLRLLIDGLELFMEKGRSINRPDEEVERVLEHMRKYAACVNWTEPFTTFFGVDMDQPTLQNEIRGTERPEHAATLGQFKQKRL